MKKIFLTGASLLFLALSAFSQEQEKALTNYGFWDNWFIQGQVGASYSFSENQTKVDFGKRISPHVAVSVGKHFSPVAGARVQVGGWEAKGYKFEGNDYKDYKFNYIQTNLDGMLNFSNLFTKYTGDKAFNLYGIAGIGYVHNFGDSEKGVETQNSIVPRVGFQADFRLNNDLSVNLEAVGTLMSDKFNGIVGGRKYDATANVLLGLTYRFNNGGFKLVDVADPALVASLNDQVNKQRALIGSKDSEISRLKAELAQQPEVVEVVKEIEQDTEILMNAVVVFRIGSAKLEQNQEINIYNAAKYLKENPDLKVLLTGYADKATGTPAINQRLSDQRAKAVADILINKYGIAANRISQKGDGSNEQPFEKNDWNRVVTFTVTSR